MIADLYFKHPIFNHAINLSISPSKKNLFNFHLSKDKNFWLRINSLLLPTMFFQLHWNLILILVCHVSKAVYYVLTKPSLCVII